MSELKNNLYIIVVVEGKNESTGLPHWVAHASHPCYFRIRDQYDATPAEGKMLLCWRLEDGLRLLRVDHGDCHFKESLNTIDLPMAALPAHDRAALHVPVYNVVVQFLKGD